MQIHSTETNVILNYLFSGIYSQSHNRGIRGKMFEFSSPFYAIENFDYPLGAYIRNASGKYIAVGRKLTSPTDTPSSDRTGALYYYDRAILYGVCHGFGHNADTHYNGYNFYNAFYPAGYFSPPYGENLSIFNSNQKGSDALQMGGCASMSITEYNETFGIISKTASNIQLATTSLSNNIFAPIYSPKEVCAEGAVAITSYYDEFQYQLTQGTTNALGATVVYNQNPIPTSLDNFDIKINGRYQTTSDEDYNYVSFDSFGKPIPSYSFNSEANKLNNALCPAYLMESDVAIGRGTNSIQLIEAPDASLGAPGDQVSFAGADPWHYWHFTFRENSSSLPFYNNYTSIREGVTQRTTNEGTLLFLPVLSSEESYWQNRQCPDTVDFLPWTFGASIYACPSQHFDIPYYAAIKKFGFYGTRFLTSCKTLNLDYPWKGVDTASELPEQTEPLPFDQEFSEPQDLDAAGEWTFSSFDNLLRTAKREEQYSNMYAFNKGFFLWANYPSITGDIVYTNLISKQSNIASPLQELYRSFQSILQNGLSSFTGNEPQVVIQSGLVGTINVVDSGLSNDILFTNRAYDTFYEKIRPLLSGDTSPLWDDIENRYSYYVASGGIINEAFYQSVVSGREKRLLTRYMENLVRGNPIDLYPLNHIYFSFDSAKEMLEHTSWGRSSHSFGSHSEIPDVARRYFEGAYGQKTNASGLMKIVNSMALSQNSFYYPGFFNDIRINKSIPTPSYERVASGLILDTNGRRYSPSGWLAIGYNDVGKLDKNFSCFTPIFTQNPLPKVFCKIGQRPTLRCSAVDYHSIPEDKMSIRYPEVAYWCEKLKLFNNKKKNLYPLKYKWLRVKKTEYSDFIAKGEFSLAEASDPSGTWCALEGDTNICTVIHPLDCSPIYNPSLTDENDYVFLQGAKHKEDDDFYYMCLASGRFGVRISNPTELIIENWLRFDVSLKNASNYDASNITVSFEVENELGVIQSVDCQNDSSAFIGAYCGYRQEKNNIPETAVYQKIPPPNAGFGDVTAYKFIGSVGYEGTTSTYKPATLLDTRGLQESWGRLFHYGNLIPFNKVLNQLEGDILYGYHHLPACEDFKMPVGKRGIKTNVYIDDNKVTHWSLSQRAVASMDSKIGVEFEKLSNIGELYPPVTLLRELNFPNKGIGHWQWANNLGAIKRFGKASTPKSRDIQFVGRGAPRNTKLIDDNLLNKVKKLIDPTALAGVNCGYHDGGFGRHMLYFVEAFERFYIICDPIKKKNVTNQSFLCPGLRQGNSAIQYFWMGKPRNTYLERRPMYGPYAYQWRVRRHNRDRNGNGISEAFYSMGWAKRYELLYDAPAVYGLYVRKDFSNNTLAKIAEVNNKRKAAWDSSLFSLKGIWWGQRGTNGTSRPYGNIFFGCEEGLPSYNKARCDYVSAALELAGSPDFQAFSCSQARLQAGDCFDPCLSLRYGQGFLPGGKLQSLFNYTDEISSNLSQKKVRLVPTANKKNNSTILKDEISVNNKNLNFRSPINTPHARITLGLATVDTYLPPAQTDVVGISPCQDGGSDHCNYITPTIHLGDGQMSSILKGTTLDFNVAEYFAANLYEGASIRGEDV